MSKGSSLFLKQQKFALAFARLVIFAIDRGYQITFPPEHEKHIPNSLHYIGLAKDINLFRNNKYLTETSDYAELGQFWESQGGTWGGRFNDENGKPKPDGCHFSFEHEGIK